MTHERTCARSEHAIVQRWLKDRSFDVNSTTMEFYWDRALADHRVVQGEGR